MIKDQSFKKCTHHGYNVDTRNGLYLENEPLCFSFGILEESDFSKISLCAHGGIASQLPDKKYCQSCTPHYEEDPDSEKQFEEVGFSPRKKSTLI